MSDSKKPAIGIDSDINFSSKLSNSDNGVWELVFESLPDMVALIDLNNIIVRANKEMRKKLKVGDSAIIGHLCFNLVHKDGCIKGKCPHLSMIEDGKSHSIEFFEPQFGCYINVSTTPIFDSTNTLLGSLHIIRDISIQMESEAKLKKYNSELKDLNLSKDKFFSIVAHDLRSPFQGMLGFTDLILDELESLSKEEIREYLQKVRDSSYSAFSLLENLLSWSRLQTGRLVYTPANFNINEDVATVISLLNSNAHSKKINLINKITNECTVFADRQMIHSILLNLTTNAIKFTHPGGTVTIDAKITASCDENSGNNFVTGKRKCLEISVSDTGVGISKKDQIRILNIDEYFTLAGTFDEHGAGLGLKLAKEMIEKHGGKLAISSQVGKGSVFAFTLLLAED